MILLQKKKKQLEKKMSGMKDNFFILYLNKYKKIEFEMIYMFYLLVEHIENGLFT
jgi:hypothetical protein